MTSVNRDTNFVMSFCAPSPKTKEFSVVQQDGTSFRLDAAGNTKAVELVRGVGKRDRYFVRATGELNRQTIRVDSISLAK
jgi:hypothetical protein